MNVRANRGLAAIELTIMAPIVLVLTMGTAEFGHALFQYNTLNKAVRDSAQYIARYGIVAGILNPTDEQETTAKCLVLYGLPTCTGSLLLPGMTAGDITLTYTPAGTPTYVTVTATYTYEPLLINGIPSFGSGVTLSVPTTFTASIRMRGIGS